MHSQIIAKQLIKADENERSRILSEHTETELSEISYELKEICNESWHNNLEQTKSAAAAIKKIARRTKNPAIAALKILSDAFVFLSANENETAVLQFERAKKAFLEIGNEIQAAESEARKIIALAILGRYDEAIECGLKAYETLERTEQTQTVELLELNIGNLYLRRNNFQESEIFLLRAYNHAQRINRRSHLAMICNSLALLYTSQNKFRESEIFYKEALTHSVETKQEVLKAVIEANLGEMALFQGKYNHALEYLEKARRSFELLGNTQRSTLAELEIADAYLELNLQPEAITRYEKLFDDFVKLGMRAEQARTMLQQGRAYLSLREFDKAQSALEKAQSLYSEEGNPIGEAFTKLTLAHLFFETGQRELIEELTKDAEKIFEKSGAMRHLFIARWLRGEVERQNKNYSTAEEILASTLEACEKTTQPQITQRCLTSLGLLKAETGVKNIAEQYFQRAIDLIENMRSPLPGEEFRTAFFSDKLVPYDEMLRLCLDDAENNRSFEALGYVERARSRALADKIGSEFQIEPQNEFESQMQDKIQVLREELNWFYSQLNRLQQTPSDNLDEEIKSVQSSIFERENHILNLMRQLQQGNSKTSETNIVSADLSNLKRHLSYNTALIEYSCLDGEWLAFVLTDEGLNVVRSLGSEIETQSLIEQFHFQIDSLRHGSKSVRQHMEILVKRSKHYLGKLYEILLEPLKDFIGTRSLAIVPHKSLHYVPFQALFDGGHYVIEKHEVCYSPSALIYEHCLSLPRRTFQKALLFGVADEFAPLVKDEITDLMPFFDDTTSFLNEDATIENLREYAPKADLIHLACHGQFRFDNPTFSTLHLGDGWLTVHDAANLKLNCELVTLSACETGVNLIAPGDELIGLARGFFAAGTTALLLSLWSVDDESTRRFMINFYTGIKNGSKPITALRQSQLSLLREYNHPFFWSPFVLIGRW